MAAAQRDLTAINARLRVSQFSNLRCRPAAVRGHIQLAQWSQ
ncbi:hypothetical protein BLL52_0493 [Rhodoferax antarcticus ANT.BR]|uniref:Uncharacterized protein n=1 Tax=Rhodoferax antarcticus ANT.BR TaxID=1111071 RepID=A0A1Q8YJR3_9BURK|nr:hypothetical protein BLL52_0493 [Rhodoferax antarcticus ANT.BR]